MTQTLTALDVHLAPLIAIAGNAAIRMEDNRLVIAPADVKQLSRALAYCNAQKLVVTPTGSGTKQSWGNPVETQVVLEMRRMNAVRDHAWQDMTVTIDAGCTWVAMQAELAKHGQTVALDPLWPEQATIGGIVATNDSGTLRYKYGSLRDLIIGMTIVLADGTIAKTGGKVVKNVAGYDLHKLMTGAYGTLAVIADVNFRLHPIERKMQSWTIAAKDAFELDKIVRALLDSQLAPVSLQLRVTPQETLLDLRLSTSDALIETQQRDVETLATPFSVTRSEDTIWQQNQILTDTLQTSERSAAVKVSLPHDQICGFAARLQHAPQELNAKGVAQGTGLMLVTMEGEAFALLRFIRTLRAEAAEMGGSLTVLMPPATLRNEADIWGDLPSSIAVMREIKHRFDPNRIMNPGRFVGGI